MRLVLDSCICIDLYRGRILPTACTLTDDLWVPDFLQTELQEPSWQEVLRSGIKIAHLFPEDISELYRIRTLYPRPSVIDLASLLVAKKIKAILLTGDKALRLAAEAESANVHGLLWLMDRLVEQQLLTPQAAVECLQTLIKNGSRQPDKDLKKMVVRWLRE
ncbi:MAG TPA: hypothetical protein PKN04_15555 [bacterium]|nr:hypothetical protein [bacterium]HNT67200.1 hypothetical protein [bacterium]HPG47220.1 hypothetical protein [bacterium]HPM99736.1 hypothetical protein [bacterium]